MEKKLNEWGASFYGYSCVEGKTTEDLLPLKYAITIGVRLSDFIIDGIVDKPTYTYFHHYRSVNALIDNITLRTMLLIQDNGYKALAVAASQTVNNMPLDYSGLFPHKTAAVMAGLGWIGKNGLFVTPDFGPRVRLGTILTDMKLPFKNSITDSCCGSCNLCVNSCPAAAITGNEWFEGCGRGHIIDAKSM